MTKYSLSVAEPLGGTSLWHSATGSIFSGPLQASQQADSGQHPGCVHAGSEPGDWPSAPFIHGKKKEGWGGNRSACADVPPHNLSCYRWHGLCHRHLPNKKRHAVTVKRMDMTKQALVKHAWFGLAPPTTPMLTFPPILSIRHLKLTARPRPLTPNYKFRLSSVVHSM